MTALPPAPDGDGFDELDNEWLATKKGLKWAVAGPGALACWVADMDFPAPQAVRTALEELAASGDLGYPNEDGPARLEEIWASRMTAKFGWWPRPDRLAVYSDLVQATYLVLQTTTSRGDGVLLLTPSYPPFLTALDELGLRLLAVPAVERRTGTGWGFDLDRASELAAQARVLVLVNPHNPTGRMLGYEELSCLAELAARHDLVVISDEIHADLALGAPRHIPFSSLAPEVEARTVTLYSASKSYNLGGMRCAVAHIGHEGARRALAKLPSGITGHVSRSAIETTLACWTPQGDAWLERCLRRLSANNTMLSQWLAGAGLAAGVGGWAPEGTYLAWLDFMAAGLGDDPAQWLLAHAKVMLSPGPSFGPGGNGFARLNFATTPGVLAEILARIARALATRA